jgi:hypothetical protein
MRLVATTEQKTAILAAMKAIALTHGPEKLTDIDRNSVAAAATIMLDLAPPDFDALAPFPPAKLVSLVPPGSAIASEAVRLATVMALVDGVVDDGKLEAVVRLARVLSVSEDYVGDLAAAARGHMRKAMAHMVRENMESFTGQPWSRDVTDDVAAWMLPYRGVGADPQLAARFEALGRLPANTFGRHYFAHFRDNGYAFPGEPDALNAGFAVPHDSAHVLAGYDTTPAGEILVSTFTAAMHPRHSMAAHVLPVIFSWHLGIKFNDVAKSAIGQMRPESFFVAWQRGANASVDVFAQGWDFWAATAVDLDELRARYAIAPLA